MAKRKNGRIVTQNGLSDGEIESAARYILERRRALDPSTWRDPTDPKSHIPVSKFNDPKRIGRIIGEAIKNARAIHNAVGKLREDLAFGRLDSGDDSNAVNELHSRLLDADQHAMRALVALVDSCHFMPKQRGTRALTEQQTAVRLAVAICERNPRKARAVAKQIMIKADLDVPTDKSLSNWITQAKNDLGFSNGK